MRRASRRDSGARRRRASGSADAAAVPPTPGTANTDPASRAPNRRLRDFLRRITALPAREVMLSNARALPPRGDVIVLHDPVSADWARAALGPAWKGEGPALEPDAFQLSSRSQAGRRVYSIRGGGRT